MVKKVLFLLTLGLLAGALAFADPVTDTLQITGNMPGQVNIVISGDIALGELSDGVSGTATVSESSNKSGYTVELSSENGWGLKHADSTERILYEFSYGVTGDDVDTHTPALGDGPIVITTNGTKTTGQTTNDKTFTVEVPTIGNAAAGNYSDTLTFELTAP